MKHSICGVRSAFLRERGILEVRRVFHAGWIAESGSPKEQWSAAADDLKVTVPVPFCKVFYLSVDGFDLTPFIVQTFLDIILHDSQRSILRILADKFRNLHALIDDALGELEVSVATLGKIADKCMYTKIAISTRRCCGRIMFDAIKRGQTPRRPRWEISVSIAPSSGLRDELGLWRYLVPTAQEGPWKRDPHFYLHIP